MVPTLILQPLVENSVRHGLESMERGGRITITARDAGRDVQITVEDDGAGIQRERVLQVARVRGLVGQGQQLSDEQVDNLIFSPGFSTAETITDISGRGVGLDVVLANLKKIGGTVHVRSWPGTGTRIMLRLPLTLAVLDVMLVDVAGNPYVIPLNSIVETLQCARADFARTPSGAQVLRVRGEYVKVIDLAIRFGIAGEARPADDAEDERFIVLCETDGAGRLALVVDDIVGQQQVVIKSLEENFEHIEGIAGGTILGDGRVALILDAQGLRVDAPQRDAA
jgi:two-component system chemotaxis sensor kinase CheA